jgi:hypothetical protein
MKNLAFKESTFEKSFCDFDAGFESGSFGFTGRSQLFLCKETHPATIGGQNPQQL